MHTCGSLCCAVCMVSGALCREWDQAALIPAMAPWEWCENDEKQECPACICLGTRLHRCVTCAPLALHARILSPRRCTCVSVRVGEVRTSCRSMCAGTSAWHGYRTGPQCVRPDVKSTWQKQIMSAPVIFSSPSALQEPFKGPNTDEISPTKLC